MNIFLIALFAIAPAPCEESEGLLTPIIPGIQIFCVPSAGRGAVIYRGTRLRTVRDADARLLKPTGYSNSTNLAVLNMLLDRWLAHRSKDCRRFELGDGPFQRAGALSILDHAITIALGVTLSSCVPLPLVFGPVGAALAFVIDAGLSIASRFYVLQASDCRQVCL